MSMKEKPNFITRIDISLIQTKDSLNQSISRIYSDWGHYDKQSAVDISQTGRQYNHNCTRSVNRPGEHQENTPQTLV